VLTLKQLQYELIRLAEQFPDRVGLLCDLTSNGDHCIMGQIAHTHGVCSCQVGTRAGTDELFGWDWFVVLGDSAVFHYRRAGYGTEWSVDHGDPTPDQITCRALSTRAVIANNSGMPWGQIPRAIGLVPDEQVTEPELVEVGA
jgi:hypothetical protein